MITKKLKNQLLIIVLNAAEFRLYEQKPEQFFDIYEIIMKLLGWTYGLLLIFSLLFAVLGVTIISNSFWAIYVAIYSLVIVQQNKYAIAE